MERQQPISTIIEILHYALISYDLTALWQLCQYYKSFKFIPIASYKLIKVIIWWVSLHPVNDVCDKGSATVCSPDNRGYTNTGNYNVNCAIELHCFTEQVFSVEAIHFSTYFYLSDLHCWKRSIKMHIISHIKDSIK